MFVACGVLVASLVATSPVKEREKNGLPHLRSESVLVRWADTGEVLIAKNPDVVRPIASITKLQSALLLLEGGGLPSAPVTIEEDDKDRLKFSRSRLRVGSTFAAEELLAAALVASDNRAIYALVRAAGFERGAFVAKMNARAAGLGMTNTRFEDPAGVDPGNVSTARDLVKLLEAAAAVQRVAEVTQQDRVELAAETSHGLALGNTNRLVRSARWSVVLGKTGYTVEAGRALALRVVLDQRPVDMVFLGSREMASVFGDAGRVKRWLTQRVEAQQAGAEKPKAAQEG